MTSNYLLDWPIMAVSLFNTIILLWLGFTVLLNAERRTWGIWLAGGGLLMGGIFFVSHSAILGLGLNYVGRGMDFWWRAGWVPVVASPFAWYGIMLWYAGFWDNAQSRLRRRQRPWLMLTTLLAFGMVGLLIFANPLPSYWRVTQLDLAATPSLAGIPILVLFYPLYIILCISLSIDALLRPEPSARMMGDLARRRARPWLVATSIVLLTVSLLVAWIMWWVVFNARRQPLYGLYFEMANTVAWFDLIISTLISIATLLIGQAIVSYEIFTGKTLPRRGLRRQWQRAIILAAGFSIIIGGSLAIQLRPIYALLLSTLLITLFHALLSWRSYAERERYITYLRPFVSSQHLYETLLTPSPLPTPDAIPPFRTLCRDILNAQMAYLVALGPLAPLVNTPLVYPNGNARPSFVVTDLAGQFDSPQVMVLPIEPDRFGSARWAIPLWSERGLIGMLLLGDKQDGSLYTQEEIEIARASGERLIDTQASAEMARRLMALHRQRLAQSRILDQQARRALHDEVLPRLHTALLSLSKSKKSDTSPEAISFLSDAHRQISNLLREIPPATSPEIARFGLINALQQMVHNELEHAFDIVTWQIDPAAEKNIHAISPVSAEVLFYAAREAIRNAAHHGRGETISTLALTITIGWQGGIKLSIEDNGVGLAASKNSPQGSGQGLALHSTMLAVVGGTLSIESELGKYTRVWLTLPPEA